MVGFICSGDDIVIFFVSGKGIIDIKGENCI